MDGQDDRLSPFERLCMGVLEGIRDRVVFLMIHRKMKIDPKIANKHQMAMTMHTLQERRIVFKGAHETNCTNKSSSDPALDTGVTKRRKRGRKTTLNRKVVKRSDYWGKRPGSKKQRDVKLHTGCPRVEYHSGQKSAHHTDQKRTLEYLRYVAQERLCKLETHCKKQSEQHSQPLISQCYKCTECADGPSYDHYDIQKLSSVCVYTCADCGMTDRSEVGVRLCEMCQSNNIVARSELACPLCDEGMIMDGSVGVDADNTTSSVWTEYESDFAFCERVLKMIDDCQGTVQSTVETEGKVKVEYKLTNDGPISTRRDMPWLL